MTKKSTPEVPMSLYEAAIQMLQDLLKLLNIASTDAPECRIAIPAAIRRFDASFVSLAESYNNLALDAVFKLGEANRHQTVRHAGVTSTSYLEVAMEAAGEWRLQIAAKIDPTMPADSLVDINFTDTDAIAKWPEIPTAVRIGNLDFPGLLSELIAESRRVWVNQGANRRRSSDPGSQADGGLRAYGLSGIRSQRAGNLMRALFRDDWRIRWFLDCDEAGCERIRNATGFEVPTLEAFERPGGREHMAEELESLFHDRFRVVDILWSLVAPQAAAKGVSRLRFETHLVECYRDARAELFEAFALANFGNCLSLLITNFHDGIEDYCYEF